MLHEHHLTITEIIFVKMTDAGNSLKTFLPLENSKTCMGGERALSEKGESLHCLKLYVIIRETRIKYQIITRKM